MPTCSNRAVARSASTVGFLAPLLVSAGMIGAGTGPLRNPGFEAPAPTQGWEVTIYGARSQLAGDSQIVHRGRQALRITALQPSDTALGQEVQLKPGQWYRLSGWVRTRHLDPHGAPTCGTLQVQGTRGDGVIAAGANHRGDTDWTEVPVYFQAPADGRVRVCLFFVGFGRGTGTAWFDEVRLQTIDLAAAAVQVTRAPLCPGRINPFQYGQFVEYLCGLVPSMWAEKLYDGSFEGLTPYKFVFLRETDFKEQPWYPSGAVNRATFSLDPHTRVSGAVSQRIAVVPGGAPCTVGISQDGLFVDRRQPCDFRIWLRARGLGGPVRVMLHHEAKLFAGCQFTPGTRWQRFAALLAPRGRDDNATLTIEFRGPGTLWLDNASLMPRKTVGGWRLDVVEAVRALKPGIIRFGGSALDDPGLGDFEWKDTLGDPDHRKPFRAWGGLQPTGPGLEEFVRFCRAVVAEPLICVRFTKRTPRDAAEEVQYFNGAADTPMGAWRAHNGHAEPYHVKYWQIGNERVGPDYDEQIAAFCRAMRAVDPSIHLLSSFPTPGVLRNAGAYLDYVCPHQYSQDLAWKQNNLLVVGQMIRRYAPGRHIAIAVTEWNTTAGDAGPRRAMLWTLANALACARYQNLLHRHCDLVQIANRSNLADSFCSGVIQTDNHRLYETPTYYAQQLYARLAGNRPLRLASPVPPETAPDMSATLTADGKAVVLFAVNDTPRPITRLLDFSAFGRRGQRLRVWTLADRRHAGEPDVTNSFAEPRRVVPLQSGLPVAAPRFNYRFPPFSLTVMRWRVFAVAQERDSGRLEVDP